MKIFLLLLIFSSRSFGNDYKCSINLIPRGKEVSKSQFDKYIKQFSWKKKDGAPGKTSSLRDISVFVWAKNKKIHLAIQKKMKQGDPLKFQTSYPFDTPEIKVRITPDIDVSCLSNSAISKLDESQRKMIDRSITDKSDLYSYGSEVIISNSTFLRFKYNQINATGMMRPIVFQSGKVYSLDDKIDKKKNWCIFNIKIKLNEDTFMQKNTKLKPVSVSKNSNNNTQTVYSYNFVDFSSGKKTFETSRYAPFSFECSLRKDQGFEAVVIKEVTGGRINVSPSL